MSVTMQHLVVRERELRARERESIARFTPAQQRTIAQHIVKCALEHERRKLHLAVIYDYEPPAFLYHWKYKNSVGVSFARKDVEAAEQWALTAITAGYRVAVLRRRDASGVVPLYRDDGYQLPQEELVTTMEAIK